MQCATHIAFMKKTQLNDFHQNGIILIILWYSDLGYIIH